MDDVTHCEEEVLFIDERMSWVKVSKIFREIGQDSPHHIVLHVREKPPSSGEATKTKEFKRVGGGMAPLVYLHSRWDEERQAKEVGDGLSEMS